MKRNIIYQLIKWKSNQLNHDKNPLILTGLKSVGKTYLSFEFAKNYFSYVYYFNLEFDYQSRLFFEQTSYNDLSKLILHRFDYLEDENPDDRLLIIDEFQFQSNIIEILDILYKDNEFPNIMLITSIETFALSFAKEYKSTIVKLNPLSFDEFLFAIGEDWYVDSIVNHYENNKAMPEIVHRELISLHELYLKIGGFPAAINEYIGFSSTINVSSIHDMIIKQINLEFKLYNKENEVLKINQVFNSIPKQLLKDNKKFQYNLIRKGTTQNYFKHAIDFLIKMGYLQIANKFNDNSSSSFKLYFPDSGLLHTSLASQTEAQYKKAILENYVANTLINNNILLEFWESDSIAKIDFIVEGEGNEQENSAYIPIELFTDENTRSKSVSVFNKTYKIPYSIKISYKNFSYNKGVKYIPYYAVFCFK